MMLFECLNKRCYHEEYCQDFEAPHVCPECNGKHYRLRFLKEPKKKKNFVNIDGTSRGNPRLSWAMGVNRQDIPEMQKRYPDRKYHPKTGQLLVESRQHKKKLMKEHGFEEYA